MVFDKRANLAVEFTYLRLTWTSKNSGRHRLPSLKCKLLAAEGSQIVLPLISTNQFASKVVQGRSCCCCWSHIVVTWLCRLRWRGFFPVFLHMRCCWLLMNCGLLCVARSVLHYIIRSDVIGNFHGRRCDVISWWRRRWREKLNVWQRLAVWIQYNEIRNTL